MKMLKLKGSYSVPKLPWGELMIIKNIGKRPLKLRGKQLFLARTGDDKSGPLKTIKIAVNYTIVLCGLGEFLTAVELPNLNKQGEI